MTEPEVTHVKIDQHKVGIIGLKSVIEDMSEGFAQKSDDEVSHELLKRLSKKNYISAHARERYGRALLREFKKYLGQPFEEESSAGLEIKVLGPGCAQCDRLEKEIMEILTEMNLAAEMEHVRDIKEIGQYSIMGTPALIINDKINYDRYFNKESDRR